MRVATWNVNGLRARFDFVLHWLKERQPDLVGLQEIKLTDELFPHSELEQLGYRAVAHCQKSWNGVAILSRIPLEVTQRGLPGEEEFGARLITAKAGDLIFTTIYCPNGKSVEHPDFPRKLAWFDGAPPA
jgi:exodeoxyribonuclease-3